MEERIIVLILPIVQNVKESMLVNGEKGQDILAQRLVENLSMGFQQKITPTCGKNKKDVVLYVIDGSQKNL